MTMPEPAMIASLTPRGPGHQFVFYGDSCSGVPGAPHERTHARVNSIVARLRPEPEFIVYPGDEIIGLVSDEAALRAQWTYWLETEMAWLDRDRIPMFHTTGNHTTYSAMSERVFADVLSHLPRNGPPGQDGLCYFVRRGDLLLVCVHTLAQALGGEGHVETEWLETTLAANADAHWKFVVGHHPAFPVNGYEGSHQRTIGDGHAADFWRILTGHGVAAYLCSHILAFDIQVHDGVLQITSAGAGTAHRMPEDIEYLHCVQMAVDRQGLRYQVLDDTGAVRERLTWPLQLPPSGDWPIVSGANLEAPLRGYPDASGETPAICAWRFTGRLEEGPDGRPQTFLSAATQDRLSEPVWVGTTGVNRRLTVILQPRRTNSPHYWFGPELGAEFDVQLAIHCGMGPGGILWRRSDDAPWSSLEARSAWGGERLDWPPLWFAGRGADADDRPFAGSGLTMRCIVRQ